MTRRLLDAEWSHAEVIAASGIFDRSTADKIIASVGLPMKRTAQPAGATPLEVDSLDDRDALAFWLGSVAVKFRHADSEQARPTRNAVIERVRGAEEACAVLLGAFASRELREVEFLGATGGDKNFLADAVASLLTLEGWIKAKSGAINAGRYRRRKISSRGAPTDWAWHALLADLAWVFAELWQRPAKLSRHPETQAPTGPFHRFVKAVAHELLAPAPTDEAIGTAIAAMGKKKRAG